jgi:hypothetical protein
MKTVPLCPKCGKVPGEITRRTISAGHEFFAPAHHKTETIVTYRCACGTSFTETDTDNQDNKAPKGG